MSSRSHDPSPVPRPGKAHILLVEDNVLQRTSLAEWLRNQNYMVIEASTADEAAVLLATPLLEIDAVITDIWMPGMMNGLDLADYIRRAFPALPVIVTSAIYKKEQAKGGYAAFLPKPYNFEEISVQLSELLNEKNSR